MIDKFALFVALCALALYTSTHFVHRAKELVQEEMENPTVGADISTYRALRREFNYSETMTKAVIMIVLIWAGERFEHPIKY